MKLKRWANMHTDLVVAKYGSWVSAEEAEAQITELEKQLEEANKTIEKMRKNTN